MKKKGTTRLYVRDQGGSKRFYGDFRDFADVGGRREALIPVGGELATSDEQLAQILLSERLPNSTVFVDESSAGKLYRTHTYAPTRLTTLP
jgi:hypothetical protein